MKILVFVVASLIAIAGWTEARPGWERFPGPGYQDGRGNYPNRGPWQYPQRVENNGFSSDVEWVCQNPRTNDIMIIASDDTRHTPQQYPDRRPWQWHNVSPGQHHSHGNHGTQPIIVVEEIPSTDKSRIPPPLTPTTGIPINNDKPTQSPPYHGGEGNIDIRLGE
ncbi:PREDICTED: uncharacterized protein LOC105567168 [Vollenhovia emeryi]|uniref:uncharacterized protein LOC105567168 n=1 Tax=Vollenhovia emeryi TaxID=411798 RepID=UPI0005F39AF7|nr:PREDICTED: uncharacterized protein LOC105567168 [Vollenhovia emeryi]